MDESVTLDRQIELPFMAAVKAAFANSDISFSEEDLICIFEGADLAWKDLLFIEEWYELKEKTMPLVVQVMIFKDKDSGLYYRAERDHGSYSISNAISQYAVEGEWNQEMVELPVVYKNGDIWVYA